MILILLAIIAACWPSFRSGLWREIEEAGREQRENDRSPQ